MEIEDSGENIHNRFFLKIWNQAYEMISGYDPYEVIIISYMDLLALGYTNKDIFEEEVMSKIFTRLSNTTNQDIEDIKDFFKDKVKYKI